MRAEVPEELIIPALRVTAISGAQVLLFVLLYEAAVEVYVSSSRPMNQVFGFEMQISYGLWLLSILAGAHTVAHTFVNVICWKLTSTILCTAVWIAYWGNVSDVVPNRFALLSVLGMFSFLMGVLLTLRRPNLKFA